MKTHQRPQIFYARVPRCLPRYGTSNDHQKPIYVSPGGRKKGHQQPLSHKKNARVNQVIFHQIANSRFFLINSHMREQKKTRRKDSLSWNPDHSIHEKFDETNSKHEKKTQPHSGQRSIKMKTHQRPQIFCAPVPRCLPCIWNQ